jgi:flagellar biosynthetic protein FlhB
MRNVPRKSALPLKLDLQMFAQEKTEPATPRKRSEARKKGQVAKSVELTGALILFFAFLCLYLLGGYMKDQLFALFTATFRHYMLWELSVESAVSMYGALLYQGFLLLAPVMLLALVIGVMGNYLQIGFVFSGEPLMMKWNKINPIEGAKRIFSMRAFVDFLKSLLKVAIVAYAVITTLSGEKDHLVALSTVPTAQILVYSAKITMLLGLKIGLILVVLAIFDYMYQRYEHEKNLRMSKQEVKDEYKKTEGDPLIKSKIRERQRRMAMQRMMQQVPKADVVITNPTHYAVALQYDAKRMEAPQVVAKGVDYLALKIREVAREHGIVIMENKTLARTLYAQVDIGQTIPVELFQAVAEVLAYVYKLKGKTV